MEEGKSYRITEINNNITYLISNITKERIKELDKKDIFYVEIKTN